MKPEGVATWIGIAAAFIGVGIAWANVGSRIDRLDQKLEYLQNDQTQPICLAIVQSEIRAIEAGNVVARGELRTLADKQCPKPLALENASATRPATAQELKQQMEQAKRQQFEAALQLSRINDQLDKAIRED